MGQFLARLGYAHYIYASQCKYTDFTYRPTVYPASTVSGSGNGRGGALGYSYQKSLFTDLPPTTIKSDVLGSGGIDIRIVECVISRAKEKRYKTREGGDTGNRTSTLSRT